MRRRLDDTTPSRPSGALWRTDDNVPALRYAERRFVSILFCDLVDSVGLSSCLDLEDYAALILAYREACARAICAAGGTIKDFLGDGVLAYFGCPMAQGDDPVRAVRAGLSLLAWPGHMSGSPAAIKRCAAPAVRVAVHSDVALVVSHGIGTKEELEVFGEAPNVAARLHRAASPGALVVSGSTFAAVRRSFGCRPLGPQALLGLPRLVDAYEVLAPTVLVHGGR
jgi:class 3 adenylate cyclase